MADTTFGLSTIGQVALSVGDIDRATEFYRDVLGMKFLFRAPPGLAFFDCAGVRLMLAAPEPESDEPPLSGPPDLLHRARCLGSLRDPEGTRR